MPDHLLQARAAHRAHISGLSGRCAVRLDPNNTDAHYNLGQAMFRLGKPDEAIRHFSVVVRLKPGDADAHYDLGVALAHQQKLDEAIGHWLEVIRLDPNNVAALVSLATGYAKTDRLREALLSLEKALDIVRSAGNQRLAQQITEQIELCKRNKPPNSPPHKSDGK